MHLQLGALRRKIPRRSASRNGQFLESLLVPKKGLEPPHPCGYMDLNHARLPIPPLRQVTALRSSLTGCFQEELQLLFYRGSGVCQTSSGSDTCEAHYSEHCSDRISEHGILRDRAQQVSREVW
jgi:hypothetical protein